MRIIYYQCIACTLHYWYLMYYCVCVLRTDTRLENGQDSLMENGKGWSKGECLTDNYVILL